MGLPRDFDYAVEPLLDSDRVGGTGLDHTALGGLETPKPPNPPSAEPPVGVCRVPKPPKPYSAVGIPSLPEKPIGLDRLTLEWELGPDPDPVEVARLKAEVAEAVLLYRREVQAGTLGEEPLRVRGHVLSDWLSLEYVASLVPYVHQRKRPAGNSKQKPEGKGS